MPGNPFRIDVLPEAPLTRAAVAASRPILERVLALDTYRQLYRDTPGGADEPFESRALRALDVTLDLPDRDLSHVPAAGPVIVVANHPHGIVDGLVLLAAVRRRRRDVRVLANHLLSRIPELADCCLFVDPFDGPGAEARSRAGLRAAHLWLRRGGALVLFPAGEVAHALGQDGGRVESPWRPAAARLALAAGAPIVPAFIHGGNSRAFYAAGRLHPALRTALLPRELLRQRGSTVSVRLGLPLRPDPEIAAVANTAVLRRAVESLSRPWNRGASC